ncbi:helix-turn-helix domain-containing protein [Rhodococcus sp. OK302]|uniref:helix-turn-helix domain-containing protein n=1 Tax=Rhodococcus sp. OK302 TaxID=1882769 RepID=UPI000B94370C|nr:helix-turn-helix domain-containing protein [Rhodococcus sp. OK302]
MMKINERGLSSSQRESLMQLRKARETLFQGGDPSGMVRPEILRSWQRSFRAGVSPSAPLELFRGPSVDLDSSLLLAGRPVISEFLDDSIDAQVFVHLLNRNGQIVGRWAKSDMFDELLGGICEIGSIVEEEFVGTSVLATVMEEKRTVRVWGPEHYNEALDMLSGAGAPIIHPGTGVVLGAISVGCDITVPLGLVSPLVTQAARDIGTALMMGHSRADRELFDSYLQVERRGRRRPMIAINSRVRLSNVEASDRDTHLSHADLWGIVQKASIDGGLPSPDIREIQTPQGMRLTVRPVISGKELIGGLVQLAGEGDAREQRAAPNPADLTATGLGDMSTERSWLGGVRSEAERILAKAPSCLVYGAQQVGKYTVARRALDALGFTVVTCEATELLDGFLIPSHAVGDCLIVRHLEEISEEHDNFPILKRALNDIARRVTVLVGTYRLAPAEGELPQWLEPTFDAHLRVPSVSEIAQEIPALVAEIYGIGIEEIGTIIDDGALHAIQERSLPGNVEQLKRVLLRASTIAGDRPISRAELPLQLRIQSTARRLSPLERVERDAISAVLLANGGNKVAAAKQLELSRSTFYRRLTHLGIA